MHKDATIGIGSTLLAVVFPGGWTNFEDYVGRLLFAVLTASLSAFVSSLITRRTKNK